MIECMCVMCHGPMRPGPNGQMPLTCGATCRSAFRVWRKTRHLNARCIDTRLLHAHRREMMVVFARVYQLLPMDVAL